MENISILPRDEPQLYFTSLYRRAETQIVFVFENTWSKWDQVRGAK